MVSLREPLVKGMRRDQPRHPSDPGTIACNPRPSSLPRILELDSLRLPPFGVAGFHSPTVQSIFAPYPPCRPVALDNHFYHCGLPLQFHRHLRSEEHTSELQSPCNLVCRLLLEKKKKTYVTSPPYQHENT